jgi:hypothetical protein
MWSGGYGASPESSTGMNPGKNHANINNLPQDVVFRPENRVQQESFGTDSQQPDHFIFDILKKVLSLYPHLRMAS